MDARMKLRSGQSTIIGGSFLILIIITAYGAYISYNRTQTAYNIVQEEIRQKDLEMQQESLTFYYDYKWINGTYNRSIQYLYLKNTASTITHIIDIGDLGDNISYNQTDIYLHPGEEFEVQDKLSELNINVTGKDIQFVTNRGNTYQSKFIPVRDTPVEDYEIQTVYRGLEQVIGDFIIEYSSFAWAKVNETDFHYPLSWNTNWEIPENNDVFFKITIEYFGEEDRSLSEYTVIHFIYESKHYYPFFIISEEYDIYGDMRFEAYTDGSIEFTTSENVKTIYFGSANPGELDVENYFRKRKKGLYNGILTIYDDNAIYSQAFPFLGITVS